jgi:steroid delta-isomerase-like uncharacterized protein
VSESSKDALWRYLDLYNRGAWDELAATVAPDYLHHNNEVALTFQQFTRGAMWIRAGLPDLTVTAEDLVEEGDRIAARWVARGTHLHSLAGEAPTSKTVVLHGITVFRFRDGLIAEDWEAMDEQSLMQQIGASPGAG